MNFEKVSRFKNTELAVPQRKTLYSAGYDLCVAESVLVPSLLRQEYQIFKKENKFFNKVFLKSLQPTFFTLETIQNEISEKLKPTLVSTGMKCNLEKDYYLELSLRSSTPLKSLLVMANSVGIIDSDYYNNEKNEGEIFFQVLNLSPYDIQLRRGDIIGQGVIKEYGLIDNEDYQKKERVGGLGSTSEKK